MSPELMATYAMLLGLLGPAPAGEPNVNMPRELVLKPGSQIVAIGDSITAAAGYLKDVDGVLAKKYPELKLPPIQNVGIGGQKAEDLVQRFQKDVIDKKPAVVTISVGINDVWHRAGEPHDPKVLASAGSMCRRWSRCRRRQESRSFCLRRRSSAKTPARLRTSGSHYVEAEKQVAREQKCTMVDLHEMFLTALAKRPAEGAGRGIGSRRTGFT